MKRIFNFFMCLITGHDWIKDCEHNSMFHLRKCNRCGHTNLKLNKDFKLED